MHFVSYEPALAAVDFRPWLDGVSWLICGGESGPGARPMHPDWARAARVQCQAAGVAFFFKQWGAFHPSDRHDCAATGCTKTPEAIHASGAREFRPSEQFKLIGGRVPGWSGMCRVGKARAGRLLDGREWSEMPLRRGQPAG